MEFWVVLIIIVLAFCVVGLLLYLLSLRASLKEVARELNDKLKTDTNTLISISSGDRAMRTLASEINCQLHLLRKERLKLQHGDMELKNAVTNISHDLRTPLTAICGYLDLLMQQPQSKATERYLSVIRERTDAMRGLTEELFRYSVISGTTEELHFEPVCLNDILEQSLAGFYGTLPNAGSCPILHYRSSRSSEHLTDTPCGGFLIIFFPMPPSILTGTYPFDSRPTAQYGLKTMLRI